MICTHAAGRAVLVRARFPHFALSPLCASLLAGLTLAPLGVAAQVPVSDAPTLPAVQVVDTVSAPNGRLNLDTPVETGSRLALTPRETPASVSVVDRSAIEARGAQDTQEILRGIPGVTAHNAPGSIGVSYRGFGGGSIGQMFNGINVQYVIAARPVDSWIYERVESIGGPSSFLFGSGAVGGSINYITKTAERSDFSEAQVRLGANNLKELSVGLNRRLGSDSGGLTGPQHFARIDINHRNSGNWVDGTHSRSTQLASSLLSDLGSGLTHTLAYEYQNEHVDRPYWGTPLLNPLAGQLRIDPATRFKNYNSTDGLYAQRVQWLRSVTQWRAADTLELRNTFYLYDALRDYRNVESYRLNAGNTQVVRSGVLLQRHDHEVVGDRLEGTYRGQLADHKSDWSFGIDVSVNRQTRFPNSLQGTVSTVDPHHFTTERFFDIPGMAPGFNPDRNNKVTNTALYLENRTAILPNVHIISALRHERIDLNLTNRRAVTAASPAFFSRSYSPTTARIGAVWGIAPGANLYAQYSTAADPPSGILSTASFADVRNNSDLTTGRQAEVGSKLDFWNGKGTAALAVYQITRKNIATQDPNNPGVTVLVGEQSSKGAEVSIGLRPTARWQLQGNLAYVDGRYENFTQGGVSLAGKTPTNTPAAVANLWVGYAITPSLQVNAGVRHIGKVYADAANTQWQGSYTLLDVGLAWKLDKSSSLTGRIRNATDRIYAANLGGQAYLGAPRTADVTLHVAF